MWRRNNKRSITWRWPLGSSLSGGCHKQKEKMKLFELFRKKKAQPVVAAPLPAPNEWGEPNRVTVTLRVLQYNDADYNEQARISIDGIERMNVCLASFLTKGVSYAQEKYNEYKRGGKDEDIEPVKAEPKLRRVSYRPTPREIAEIEAWAKEVTDKKGGKR